MKQFGSRARQIATILVKRGCLNKTGSSIRPVYKWNPVAMKPTSVFVASVAEEIHDRKREANVKYYAKSKKRKNDAEKETPCEIEDTFFDELEQVVNDNPIPCDGKMPNGLELFTDEDLWEELKARGYVIEDGRLIRHIVKILN